MTPPRLAKRLAAGRDTLDALARSLPDPQLAELLERVEEVLRNTQSGADVVCRVCHDRISPERAREHPLVDVCLECMTAEQRDALGHDLRLAGNVQRKLLPSPTTTRDGWEVQYLWEPFGAVSGDHLDLVRPQDDTSPLHLLVGDVAGKGLAASLLQSHLHALFRALAPHEDTLCELVARANRLFFEATFPSAYATLVALRLYRDGTATLVNAGHPRPLLADRRGVRPIEDASFPVGVVEDARYGERTLRLRPGETLLIYTDGWTEAERDGEEYGVGRAAAALRRARHRPLDELLSACRDDHAAFLGGAARADDLTMVAVRRTRAARSIATA
jgi:sigma-B regulation protein RsbU (phosphoserine phosphatase)